ncbi:hypothetical protein SAY86_009266 [Trapa natans]|uniref:S-protein homolog n=1 Tax=Trapa natans TaxID=22666 RepID=A0AAN7QR17_TRANT|nr:hypothetical protein SAY86_009266 [Trapa natans]
MHKNKITLLFLILLFVAVAGENDQRRVHVEVRNMLPPTHNFTIHCKSKDDDLGVHIVGLNQVYTFHFQRSILGRMLFFCWLNTEYGHGIYDLYKQTRTLTGASSATGG